MAQSREDRVYMAYRVYATHFMRQGSRTPKAHAILEVCKRFNLTVNDVRQIVNERLQK